MTVEREAIRARVRELLERRGDAGAVGDRDPLLTSGRLDSVDVLELVTFLEAAYAVDFTARPFDPDDFDSIDAIAALLARA
jgi:acyl carrier protein